MMVDIERLSEVIESSGLKPEYIAKKADMSYRTLYNRMHGVGEFTASEIVALSKALRLSVRERNSIFLT